MKIGDTVVLKRDSRIHGVVTAIDDWGRATVKLSRSGVEVLIHICDLAEIEETEAGVYWVLF